MSEQYQLPDGRERFFFCGIGGSGMSAIASILAARRYDVVGSDRSFDAGQNTEMAERLKRQGIELVPQDGSGVDGADVVVVSTAVESTIPDVKEAQEQDIPIIRRADLLRAIFERGPAVAVGGTSGKTTVTAMIGHILRECGKNPTVINGGIMLNSRDDDPLGNAWAGDEELCVIEADESDGTIELYSPKVAVVTTISFDHRPLDELRTLFREFIDRAETGCVFSADCPEAGQLAGLHPYAVPFGIDNDSARLNACKLQAEPDGISFEIAGLSTFTSAQAHRIELQVPGRHNVRNALAAIGACTILGVPREEATAALRSFRGTHRRLELVGTTETKIRVYDDFAHNPEKIQATLETLTKFDGRVIAYFQPHGFGPMRMLKEELIEAFRNGLRADDVLLMPEIYFAGGTVTRGISSKDLTDAIAQGEFVERREAALERLKEIAEAGDRIVVMGARDNTLSHFAREILNQLS